MAKSAALYEALLSSLSAEARLASPDFPGSVIAARPQMSCLSIPDAEPHILDAGHFAQDERPDEIAAMVKDFLARTTGQGSIGYG